MLAIAACVFGRLCASRFSERKVWHEEHPPQTGTCTKDGIRIEQVDHFRVHAAETKQGSFNAKSAGDCKRQAQAKFERAEFRV